VNGIGEAARIPFFLTTTGPELPSGGTVARAIVEETGVNAAFAPLKVTLSMPFNPSPVIVTSVPAGPCLGASRPRGSAERR
jgi:hypothetical protein